MATAFVTKLRAQIEQTERRITELEQELVEQRIRAQTLRQTIEMYGETEAAADSGGQETRRQRTTRVAHSRSRSRFGFILDQIRAASPKGLKTSEIYDVAERAGIPIKRNTVRSQLWHAKASGQIEYHDGRYRTATSHKESGQHNDDSESETPAGSTPAGVSHAAPVSTAMN